MFSGVHHIAVICSNYAASRAFYVEVLGFRVVSEVYRDDRRSYKLNLAIPGPGEPPGGGVEIELFSFEAPSPPPRPTRPEACGLRHLALRATDFERTLGELRSRGVALEPVRLDPHTGRRFTFFADPDGLPIEVYEG